MAYQVRIRGGHATARQLLQRAERLTGWRMPRGLARRLASRPFAREEEAIEDIAQREQEVRAMCAQVDHFIAPSAFLAERYVEFGIARERITVSDYGFDVAALKSSARTPRSASAPLRVAYIGTWIPSKGVHVLIEAFRGIGPSDAVLDVHGYAVPYDGFDDYESHLRSLAGGAANIRFRGPYEPRQTRALLEEADVVVVPSIWYENSPLTIHEAFLAGVPVIASRQGGMQELVADGRSGLLFRPGDPESLRGALRTLIRDRNLLGRLRSGLPAVKPIESDAAELCNLYATLGSR
jgi:glycosyltransferase involved in cell wall biosynthesis